ncbi:hypothetical protein RHOSPDRAFT_24175 [Rhodotorula sp. JG-1b]|nr:hypothetical protein RHOSPDRAFT_24175 [Rhodotorula sp. JG-1b]
MLFDTPLLDNPKPPASESKQDATAGHKRRRSSVGDHGAVAAPQPAATEAPGMSFDVNKLLQKMQDQAPKAKSGKGPPAGAQPKQKQQPQDGPSKKRQREDSSTKPAPTSEQKPQAVTSPATPAGEGKRAKKSKKKAAAAAVMADSPAPRPSEHPTPVASTSRSTTTTHEAREVVRHSAPSLTVVGSTLTGSTKKGSVQDKLRAQLAGGKFRMLNEQLYTTSGDDAHRLMKEDGAFDDYHIGFRSQAATWPVHPLALIAQSLLTDLPPNSLIADFGCGDAALARTLCPPSSSSTSPSTISQLPPIPSLKVPAKAAKMKQLKVVSFDLVSQSSYVVEAECSSVPLPGGVAGGEVVDAVVCCLSLMGTDWIRMLREARRVLKEGGVLKIAEVSSRFTSFDDFVKLVKELGFSLANRDESNTHFVLFDFVKQAGSDATEHPNKVTEHDRKAATLLNPCIYKRR